MFNACRNGIGNEKIARAGSIDDRSGSFFTYTDKHKKKKNLQVSSGMTQSRRHPSEQHLDWPAHWSSVWHSSVR